MDFKITPELMKQLQDDIPILAAQIKSLYTELDRQFHLNGAKVPVSFGFDKNLLGSYTQASNDTAEHFYFSLLFAGYSVAKPLSKEERLDLYKHEYAHYMRVNMEIPKEYEWQPGIHGSAWKYCCSLIGAVPTPFYKAGEALMPRNYEKVLKKTPIHDKTIPLRDHYRREQEYQKQKNRGIQYQPGQTITHPTFGEGIIEDIKQTTDSVRLYIRFSDEIKIIDQKWLLKTKYQIKK